MDRRAFTLLEVMMATAVFSVVMGVIFTMSLGFANSAQMQEIKINTTEEARRAMLILAPRLRQASRASINWGDLPGDSITFRMAADLSGNGMPVGPNGFIELTGPVTITRDADDANEDGMTMTQLVMIGEADVRVLANDVAAGPAPEAPAADAAPDNVGFWVRPQGRGLEVTVRAEQRTPRGHFFSTTVTEFIVPRN